MEKHDLKEMKVLYVEDEEEARNVSERFLRKEVKELYVASNGEEGIKLFKEHLPDIVVTDLNMPVMDGIALAAEVKKYNHETPVIVTTAFNDEKYFLRSIDVGVDKYLKKPINIKQLLSELSHFAKSILIQEKLSAVTASNEEKYLIMLEEMEMAASFQQSLLPNETSQPRESSLDFKFLFKPCSPVSGDFLIVDSIDGRYLIFIVIDVMGHGVASGLITIEIKTLYEQFKKRSLSPAEMLRTLNKEFLRLSESSFFLTATCAIFDSETSTVKIASAGGVPFIHFHHENKKGEVINLDGTPIGLYPDDEIVMTEEDYDLKQGDFLIFQTDGLIESFNEEEKQYDSLLTQEKFISQIQVGKTPEMVLHDIFNDVKQYKGRDTFDDDVTLIVIKKI